VGVGGVQDGHGEKVREPQKQVHNGDGGVNIFDLVIVAGNFGQSLLAAPTTAAKIEFSTDQKRHIATAIDQLAAKADRSTAEEMALNVLNPSCQKDYPAKPNC